MEKTKMTLKIYEPLLKSFDSQIDRLCLKRDAFLNHMLKTEVIRLKEDLGTRRQSPRARRYVSGELKRMGTHSINMVVDKDVANLLNEIVETHNVVRDAFVNRLLMFLRGSPKLLNHLGLPLTSRSSNFDSSVDATSSSPLAAMEEVFSDPMYYLRTAAQERFHEGIYTLELPKQFIGFSCYLPDREVPGTLEQKEFEQLGERLIRELEQLESLAFNTSMAAPSTGEAK